MPDSEDKENSSDNSVEYQREKAELKVMQAKIEEDKRRYKLDRREAEELKERDP